MTNQQLAAQTCQAEAGVVTADPKFLCLNEPIVFTPSGFNDDVAYSQLYLLVDNQTQIIVDISNTIIFASPGSGEYNIYAFNYLLNDAPDLPEVGDLLPNLVNATGCFDLSNVPFQIIVFTEVDIQGTPRCVGADTTQYFVDLSITGGAPLAFNGGFYAINQEPNIITWSQDSLAGVGTVGPFASGDTAIVVVKKDGTRCLDGAFDTLEVVFTCPPPPDCITDAGQVSVSGSDVSPSDTLVSLLTDTISVTLENAVLGDDDVVQFLLHDGSPDFIGNVLVQNGTGIFTFDENSMDESTVYFIDAVAGVSDDEGEPDPSDDCTVFASASQPVLFLAPITPDVSLLTNCTSGPETFIFTISATGGLPDFSPSTVYTVTIEKDGFVIDTDTFLEDEEYMVEFNEMGVYQIIIEDEIGIFATVQEVANCTVPVELLSFTGKVKKNENRLTWSTASEYNTNYFLLEHSIDGQNFTTISKVAAAGYSNTVQQYEVKHTTTDRTNYYKLSQSDTDGELKSYGVITLVREGLVNEPIIVVNPTTNNIDLQLETVKDETVQIDVFDRIGRLVKQYTLPATQGNNVWNLDGSKYTSGVYIARVKTSQGVSSVKFLTNRK